MSEIFVSQNNMMARDERMPLRTVPQGYIQCANCLRAHAKKLLRAAGFICHECLEMVCIVCGCTDSAACEEGCSWIEAGLCSSHEEAEG